MGFGAIFLGIMFLYDFSIPLARSGVTTAYLALDIFPDFAGWILLFFGLMSLSKKASGLSKLRFLPIPLFVLSILTLLKDTLWFSAFYTVSDNRITQGFAGVSIEVCIRLMEVAFLYVLFDKTSAFCRRKGEDKLSLSHQMTRRIALVEGGLFAVSRLGLLLPLTESMAKVFTVLSQLDNLFFVFLIWHAAIGMVRALIRITD